jgi:uncharacterized protein (TIGR00297 family)
MKKMETFFLFRCVIAIILALLLSVHGYTKKSLDISGCIAACFVGFICLATSYRFGLLLLLFYYSSSKLTKLKENIKIKLEEDYSLGGQRNWIQVFANSILATVVCLFYYFSCGDDTNISFRGSPSSKTFLASQFACMIVAHFACANGDTWASEVGILSKSRPRLVTSLFFREVPPGTNGGMSFKGTWYSLLGGMFIGFVYFSLSFFYVSSFSSSLSKQSVLEIVSSQYPMILFGGFCGLGGSLIDSLMGATLQATYYSKERKLIVKNPKDPRDRSIVVVCGKNILSNEAVNFLSIAVVMILSWFFAPSFFRIFLS